MKLIRAYANLIYLMSIMCIICPNLAAAATWSPTTIIVQMTSGDNEEAPITITNNDDINPIDLSINVSGLGQSQDSIFYEVPYTESNTSISAQNYISLSDNALHILPRQTRKLYVEIQIPAEDRFASRYAMIELKQTLKEINRSQESLNSNASIINLLGIGIPVIIVNPNSQLIKTGEISSFKIDFPKVYLAFRNTGNTYYKAIPQVIVRDNKNKQFDNLTTRLINSIMPNSELLFEMNSKLEDQIPPGNYTFEAIVKQEDGSLLDRKEISLNL